MTKYKTISILLMFFLGVTYFQNAVIVNPTGVLLNHALIEKSDSNQIRSTNLFSINNFQPLPPSLNTHSPITIIGDNQISLYNTSGSGTPTDPYVIANLNITANVVFLIRIVNTSKTIIIKDNLLNGVSYSIAIGIDLNNASNIIIDNNEIIQTDEGIDATSSPNLTIKNNFIHSLNAFGNDIIMDKDDSSIVENNNLSVAQGFAIQFRNSHQNIIQNNNFFLAQVAILSMTTVSSTIFNNSISAMTATGIDMEYSNESTLQLNTINMNTGAGIQMNYANDNYAFNNKINGTNVAFFETFSCNNTYASNIITNPIKGGFSLDSSNNTVIKSNSISNVPQNGIFLSLCNQNTIISNTIIGNSVMANGIYLEFSNFNFISTNTIESFNILLELVSSNWNNITYLSLSKSAGNETELFSSNYNMISNSNFDSSGNYGLTINGGIDNKILLNVFQNSRYYSLFITNAQDTIIEKNDFLGVPHYGDSQAFDNGMNTLFKYNYWQGYTAPDSNHDGFVDYPFLIDGPAQTVDYYPLITASQINNVFMYIGVNATVNTTTITATTTIQITANNSSSTSTNKASPGFTVDLLVGILPFIAVVSLFKRKKINK